MKNKKEDARSFIALKIVADIFLRSTTKFSSTTKLPKQSQVDQKLKQRALAAIQSKSPQNKRINVNRISDLGSSPLFQGLDLVPEKNKKPSGNQQRHRPVNQQSPAKPQRHLNGVQYNNDTDSKQKQLRTSSKKPLQRQHNRNPENQLNDSRNLGQQKQIKGNIVSQNLHRNQKGIKDDFDIGDKSMDKRRKYSNQNNKSLIQQTKIMSQSRAKSSPKENKAVSFSPQKPKQNFNVTLKKTIQIKPTTVKNTMNEKESTYVYVPPKRKTIKEETTFQLPIQSQTHLPRNQQPSQKKIQTQQINTSIIRKPTPRNLQPVIQKTPRPIQKNPMYRSNAIERNSQANIMSQKSLQQTSTIIKESNISIQNSLVQKGALKHEKSRDVSPRKRVEFTEQEMRQDWSKIKQTLKYDSSLIPSKIQSKNISQRQDVALKMIAQLFLDASTRYFPGLSMLLRRGISKQDIQNIRSKSSQFKINIFGAQRKSTPKPQPKTQRRLNWKDNQSSRRIEKQISEDKIQEISIIQYKNKRLQEIEENRKAEQMETSQSQSRIQKHSKSNTYKHVNQQQNKKIVIHQTSKLINDNKSPLKKQNETKKIPEANVNNTSTVTNKKQTYVYQPPVKRQQTKITENQSQTKIQKTQLNTQKPIFTTKTSIESIQSPLKAGNKSGNNQKTSSNQLMSSKSTTSIVDKKIVNTAQKNLRNSDALTKKEEISKSYVYQPPTFNKKDNSIVTQKQLPTKNDTSSTLRNVKSQKTIKIIESNISTRDIKSPLIKKESEQIIKETKQVNFLTKKLCSLLALIIKKRMNSNISNAFEKINQQSKIVSQNNKHSSYFLHDIQSFSKNYQTNLKRQAFRKIKTNFLSLFNKNLQNKKITEQNSNFLTQRKENIARIIFLILKNKISSYFEPIKLKSEKVQRKAKATQRVSQILGKIVKNKATNQTKSSFDKIKKFDCYKNQTINHLNTIIRKLKYSALSDNFTSFVTKNIKNMGIKAPYSKEGAQILIKSKSQEVISSSKNLILSGQLSSIQLSLQDQKKIANKQKQLDRKVNDLEKKRQNLHEEVNSLNKDKRAKNKKNSDLKTKLKQVEKQQLTEGGLMTLSRSASKQYLLSQEDLIPVLTRAYAYLFEDPQTTNVSIERFLSDNQQCFQLPTNSTLLNEWKVISKNAELKNSIKVYEGEQPREKEIYLLLKQQNSLMTGLLRSFVRERYIWQWVNIIARQ